MDMLTFIVGVVAGVFADRLFPAPVSKVIDWVKAAWGKISGST